MFKRIAKILTLIIVLFGISMFAIPYIYKDKIVTFIKNDINNTLTATFDFKDVTASLFSDFPNLSIKLREVSLDGQKEFKDTRLLDAKNIGISINLTSIFSGEQLIINKLDLEDAFINILVLKNGVANYDIIKKDSLSTDTDKTKFTINLKSYSAKNAQINYEDKSLNLLMSLQNINHQGKGHITESLYQLNTKTNINNISLKYDGTRYINQLNTSIISDFDINGDFTKYTLKNSKILLNQLPLSLDGFFELLDKGIKTNIQFTTKQAGFKNFISLIPKDYLSDFQHIKTKGTAQLKGTITGGFFDDFLPAFSVNLSIDNASLKYPDLPEEISNMYSEATVRFPGGKDLDATTIDFSKIKFTIANNNVSGNLKITYPITDPNISTSFKSKFDLNKIQQAIKFKGINELSGLVDVDFSLKGAMSAIEKETYDQFQASGYLDLQDVHYQSDSLPYPVTISKAALKVQPKSLNLSTFKGKIGTSDFSISGSILNYLTYIFGKDTQLKAKFKSISNRLNVNEFMANTSSDETTETTGVIKVPKNLDANIQMSAETVNYKDLDLQNVKGTLHVKDQKIDLSSVLMQVIGGQLMMHGYYDSSQKNPKANLNVNMEKMSIEKSAESFKTFATYTPILKELHGNFFSKITIDVELDSLMNPKFNVMNMTGSFTTEKIIPKDIDLLNNIAGILKLKELENPYIDRINTAFSIKKGNLTVKPFQFKLNDMNAALQGTVNLDQQVNFILKIAVPQRKLGTGINTIIKNIQGGLDFLKINTDLDKDIQMRFKITGGLDHPIIKPFVANNKDQSIDNAITEIVQEKVDDVRNNAISLAEQEAEQLIAKAEFNKEKILEKAEIMAEDIRNKSKEAAQKLEQEAGDDPIKKMAAKMAGNKLKNEADKKADKLIVTATKKGDQLIENARLSGNKIIEKAKNIPIKDSI